MSVAAAPRPSVHTAILLPHQRLIRQPLPSWAATLDATVRRVLAEGPELTIERARRTVACFNEVALVETYFGRRDRAATLCWGALDWVAAARRLTSSDDVWETAFQPFVNLGRLARIERRWRDSLDMFRTVRNALHGQPPTLGVIELDESALVAALRDAEVRRSLENMYVIDSLKTLLKAEWHDEAIAFAEDALSSVDDTNRRQSLREGLAIALCRAGRCDEAAEIAQRELTEPHAPYRAMFVFRRAEALIGAGRVETARPLCRTLEESFQANPRAFGQSQLALLIAFLPLARVIGFDVESLAVLGYTSAVPLGDVLLQCELLDVLTACAGSEEARRTYARDLTEVRRASWYGGAATAGASEEGRRLTALMDVTFDRLMAAASDPHP
jgi:tetratricopeptide (TPR) repeat protein